MGVAIDSDAGKCLEESDKTTFWGATLSDYYLSSPVCLSICLSVCDVGVLWPNGWMDQDATWYGGRQHCVRWGPSSPPRKGAH